MRFFSFKRLLTGGTAVVAPPPPSTTLGALLFNVPAQSALVALLEDI